MNLEFNPKAETELKQFNKNHRKYVMQQLRELKENPTGKEKTDLITIQGRDIFKYVMKEGEKGGKDYRAVYDIENNKVKIYAVFHRDQGYDKQMISDRL